MNVGVYVRALESPSPAATRFQETILQGLQTESANSSHHFYVLSDVIPPQYVNGPKVSFVPLQTLSAGAARWRRLKVIVGGVARRALNLVGARGAAQRVQRWRTSEPAYYAQLRDLDIRIIWNCGKDTLDSYLPNMVVHWDSNHRIHSEFPEFSERQGPFQWPEGEDQLLRRAAYVIVGTEQGKSEAEQVFRVAEPKLCVIPFPTPILPAPAPGPAVPRPRYVYYPGRFKPHKNQIVLIYALAELREKWGIDLHCVLSGIDDGNLGYVLRTAEKLCVRDQVEYVGNVSTAEMSQLYRDALALTYTSAMGPDNFPPLEAMAVGCPVIAADVPGASEQMGDAALLFERTSEAELALCIKRLIEEEGLRESLIEKGHRRAAAWTPVDYARSVIKILDEFALVARMWERGDFQVSW